MIFKINNVDYSNRVIAGSHAVNNEPLFEPWVDANGRTHKLKVRDKAIGTFDMWFRDLSEYNAFIAFLANCETDEHTHPCEITVNNTATEVQSQFFLEFKPKRNIDGNWTDYLERFTVSIEEA